MQEFIAKLRALCESTDVMFSFTTPGLLQDVSMLFPDDEQGMIPRLSLDVESLAKEIYWFSPASTSFEPRQLGEVTTNVTITHTDPFSSVKIETTNPAMIPAAYWSQFHEEQIFESMPLPDMHVFPDVPTCSSVSTSTPPPPLHMPSTTTAAADTRRSSASTTTLTATATSSRNRSESTGNKNRRAKRKAKVGELYSTGTMKRQAEPKPYDRMVNKYRIKL